MARLIAIEWDAREARVAVARTRTTDALIEDAFAVDLVNGESDESHVGTKIAAALAARNLGRGESLVAVGRANIELRQLSLPPSPFEELPDLVRFQAMREFTTIGEDWPLDFVHVGTGDDDTFSVLAAAIAPQLVKQIQQTCETAELTASRLVLRPFAAASLLRRHDKGTDQPCRLMVDLLTDEADLTVLDGENLILMRTVRLPSTDDSEAQARAVLGEIRRTIASAQSQMRGRRVEKIILCGDGSDQATLKETIESKLPLDVVLFDPFDGLSLDRQLKERHPEHSGRFAPLLGMLLDEATASTHAIDFLHPRKRPEPPDRTRQHVLAGAAIAATVLAIAFGIWMSLSGLDREIDYLNEDIALLQSDAELANQRIDDAGLVEQFLDSNVNWLDELDTLSKEIPPPEEVIVSQVRMGTRAPKGSQIILDLSTKQPDQIRLVRDSLRLAGRTVDSTGSSIDQNRPDYPYGFKETVLIPPLSELPDPDDEDDAVEEEAKETAPAESAEPAENTAPADDTEPSDEAPADDTVAGDVEPTPVVASEAEPAEGDRRAELPVTASADSGEEESR